MSPSALLQYNPPYTIPWRRRNELAFVVVPREGGGGGEAPATVVAAPTAAVDVAAWREKCDTDGVVSFYDYGLRANPETDIAAVAVTSTAAVDVASWRGKCDVDGVMSFYDYGLRM